MIGLCRRGSAAPLNTNSNQNPPRSSTTVTPSISLSVAASAEPIPVRPERCHVTSMQQHNGQPGVVAVNSGQSKSPPLQAKPRFCRAVDDMSYGLITRRSQVQILPPPPLERPGNKGFPGTCASPAERRETADF